MAHSIGSHSEGPGTPYVHHAAFGTPGQAGWPAGRLEVCLSWQLAPRVQRETLLFKNHFPEARNFRPVPPHTEDRYPAAVE